MKKILNCSFDMGKEWKWIAPYSKKLFISENQWEFYRIPATGNHLFTLPFQFTEQIKTCNQCIKSAKEETQNLIISHDPKVTARLGLLAKWHNCKTKHLAYAFNFAALPSKIKKDPFSYAFSTVSDFVVFSKIEQKIYSRFFGIPEHKFHFLHWGVQPPKVAHPQKPLVSGEYITAIGGHARDYPTLMQAMKSFPNYHCVIVAGPHNLQGLDIPKNVTVYTNIALEQAMNILKFAKFSVLPLVDSTVLCGHVTIVSGMYLGTPSLVTESSGLTDYAIKGETAEYFTHKSVEDLCQKIQTLWNDEQLLQQLSENGLVFANTYCTQERTVQFFENYYRGIAADAK